MVQPLISVITITYNHAAYIRRCIEGVLAQQCVYPFEYIIGEDCSTDGTREIVQEYAALYPDVIKLITSESNVGMAANSDRCFTLAQGKYVALCEGDDCWTDALKLQDQMSFLIANKEYRMSCSPVMLVNETEGYSKEIRYPGNIEDNDSVVRDLIVKGVFCLSQISSTLFERSFMDSFPAWWHTYPVGDYPFFLFFFHLGKVHYLDRVTTIYHYSTPASWTQQHNAYLPKALRHNHGMIEMLEQFDEFTAYQYRHQVQQRILQYHLALCSLFPAFSADWWRYAGRTWQYVRYNGFPVTESVRLFYRIKLAPHLRVLLNHRQTA